MNIIKEHIDKYPFILEEDLIKLLYQRCFGPGHLILDKDRAMKYLLSELSDVKMYKEEYEEIGNGLVRVYFTNSTNASHLVDALIMTANNMVKDKELFHQKVNELVEYITDNKLTFNLKKIRMLEKKIADSAYQPIHHSNKYRDTYNPHYRVISKSYL